MTKEPKMAIYFDCRESERLEFTHPAEAIIDLFDVCYSWSGVLTLEEIAKHCPVTVTGHAPATISSDYVYSCAESAVERFEETLSEEFGDPDGDWQMFVDSVRQDLTERMFGIMSDAAKTVQPWLCDVVEKKEYNAQEVYDILRDEMPEWFDEEYYER